MASEKELTARIRQLEEMNSALQDKLDMIYSIIAPEFEEVDGDEASEGDEEEGAGFVQIQGVKPPKSN